MRNLGALGGAIAAMALVGGGVASAAPLAVTPTITVKGRLGQGTVVVTGSATPGATATLYTKGYGDPSFTITSSSTVSQAGTYLFTPFEDRSAEYFVSAGGASSPDATSTVTDVVIEEVSVRGRAVTVAVGVNPAVDAVRLRILSGSRAVRWGRLSAGRYRVVLRPGAGTHRYQAVVTAGDGTAGAASATHEATVRSG